MNLTQDSRVKYFVASAIYNNTYFAGFKLYGSHPAYPNLLFRSVFRGINKEHEE